MHGFFFTINSASILAVKSPYHYEITFSDGNRTHKKLEFINKYESMSGFYTFKVAGIEEGTTGAMYVKVSGSSGKENAAGIAYVYYPSNECSKRVFLGIDATVSCAGFNADFYGLLTLTQNGKAEVDGAFFLVFTPDIKKYYIDKVYNGQSVKVSDGRKGVVLELKEADAYEAEALLRRS